MMNLLPYVLWGILCGQLFPNWKKGVVAVIVGCFVISIIQAGLGGGQ